MELRSAMKSRTVELLGKKILITGASGFIGTHLCDALTSIGCDVHATTRLKRGTERLGIQWWQSDLTVSEEVETLFCNIKPDFVYHLAGLVSGARDSDLVIPMINSNFVTSVNILNAAKKIGCTRLFLIGSMEEPADANLEISPCSPYAAAKWASSAYGRMYHALYQVPVVILRLFMSYGPGQHDGKKLIPYVIRCLLNNEPPELSSGRRMVDWVYVDDVVEAMISATHANNIEGQTIEIGSGHLISIKDIVDRLVQLVGTNISPHFGMLGDRPLEHQRVADLGSAIELMGWRPKISLDEGLALTVHWYREQFERSSI